MRQVGWAALIAVVAACRPRSTATPVSDAVESAVVGSDGRVDGPTADEENIGDLIEITGTAEQFVWLPGIAGLLIYDHGQTPIGRGRWKVSGYCAVKNTPDVLKRIRALGLTATVPLSVAERKRHMQPAPAPPR